MKDFENLSIEELRSLRNEIDSILDAKVSKETVQFLKKSSVLKSYAYIIFTDDSGDFCLGLNSRNEPGYIDDHIPEEFQEDVEELLSAINHWGEIGSCTYSISEEDVPEIERIMAEVGVSKQEPAWQ